MDESNFLEEMRNWEHPPWYGITQFEEKVKEIFLENQKGLHLHHLTTRVRMPVKREMTSGPCQETSYTANSLCHWNTLTSPELHERIWMLCKKAASMIIGISMDLETCQIFGQVSLIFSITRKTSRRIYVVRGENGKRHPGQIIYGQNSGEEWPGMLSWGKSRNGQLKNQRSIMLEDYEESISLTLRTRSSRKPFRMLERNWKHQWLQPCLARHARKAIMERPVARLMNSSLNLRESWKPENPQECEQKNLYQIIMRTTLQEDGTIHYNITIWYTNSFLCLKQWRYPQQKAAVDRECEKLENIPAWEVFLLESVFAPFVAWRPRSRPPTLMAVVLCCLPRPPLNVPPTLMAVVLCCLPRPPLNVLAIQTVVSMDAPGRTTDTVMDSGDGVSHTVPFYRGYAPPHSVLRFDLARRDLTKNLMKFATEQKFLLASTTEREIAQDISEKWCYTELISTAEINKDKTFELPDGNIIIDGAERFRCAEVWYQSSFTFQEASRFHDTFFQSYMRCYVNIRKNLYAMSCYSWHEHVPRDFCEHDKELTALFPSTMKFKVFASPVLVWIEGSSFSSFEFFSSLLIIKSAMKLVVELPMTVELSHCSFYDWCWRLLADFDLSHRVQKKKRFRRGTWPKSETHQRWSMKQGRKTEKFILPHWWTSVIWRMPNWRHSTQNTKVELYSEATLWKKILDLMQYLQDKDHQHHKWRQQKSWISYSDCQDAQDKQLTQYLLIPRPKWKMLQNYWKISNRNFQTFGFVYHDTSGQNHGPVWKTQSFLLSGICTVILWQDCYGKSDLSKSYWNTVGRRFPIGNAYSVHREKWLFSSVCVDDMKFAGKKQNINPMWKVLTKKLSWENQHHSLIIYAWDVLKDNVK